MAVRRVQDLEQYWSAPAPRDLFQADSVAPNGGYSSVTFRYGDLLGRLSAFVESRVMDTAYDYASLPVGTFFWEARDMTSADYLSSAALPADGLIVRACADGEEPHVSLGPSADGYPVQEVVRNDLGYLFQGVDLMTDVVGRKCFPKEGYNIVLAQSGPDMAQYLSARQYDGMFVYSPNDYTLRLPKLDRVYVRSVSRMSDAGVYTDGFCPALSGQFVNGITTYEIADGRPLSDMYTGAFFFVENDAVKYYETNNSITTAIYKKSLTKRAQEADAYAFRPDRVLARPVYGGEAGEAVMLDSFQAKPFMVVTKSRSVVRSVV